MKKRENFSRLTKRSSAKVPPIKKVEDVENTVADFFESANVYKLLFEIANDGIAILDKDFRVVDTNEATERIYGWTREETFGKNIFDVGVIPPERERAYYESMKSAIEGLFAPDTIIEIEIIRKDGAKISVEVSNRIIRKHGKPMGFLNITRDITDRKRMEQALLSSEEKARALLNATTDAVMLIDSEGHILDINSAYARTFGRRMDNLVGRKLWDLIPHDFSALNDYVDRVIEIGQAIRFEQEYRGVWTDNVIYPVLDIKNTVSRVAIFSHDITKRKKAEEELIQHRDHLEEVVKVRTLNLEQTNTALKVLLKRREEDKTELEDKMVLNIKELVLPYFEELKGSGLKDNQKILADFIEYNLNDIISPFVKKLSSKYLNLTSTEIRIANLIKQGKSSKEIADQLNTSLRTIDTHRYRIRKKLGIKRKKTNLATYLLSIN